MTRRNGRRRPPAEHVVLEEAMPLLADMSDALRLTITQILTLGVPRFDPPPRVRVDRIAALATHDLITHLSVELGILAPADDPYHGRS